MKRDPHELILRPPVHPEGPGSVSGAPNLPAGFTDTFTSRYIDTGAPRLRAVIGGEGRRCCRCASGPREPSGEAVEAGEERSLTAGGDAGDDAWRGR